jgi:HD-GYP domain-containing protein (c-di-GMP phosphodiesterase class II)
LRSHINFFPEVVRLTVKDDPGVIDLLASDNAASITPRTVELFSELLSLAKVFRAKVWGRNADILWCDQAELIGQRFPDNEEFLDAMRGELSYEIAELGKAENIDERNRGITLEIYTPVARGGTVLGVVEVYEADQDLFRQIARNTALTWILVLLAGVILWALLFAIFRAAYRRQRRTTAELLETQGVTIFALAHQAELRDRQTGKHLERTAIYVRLLAEELARDARYRGYLTAGYLDDLVKSAPLHDIGKVGIPDSILLKPGKLEPAEMDEMRRHCEYGSRVLIDAEKQLNFQSFLTIAIQLTLYHHEKWDGAGYPHGLRAESIPLSARIMALADNYDALRTQRPYKRAFPHAEASRIIRDLEGIHFDPALVAAFGARERDFERVSVELGD